MEGLTGHIEFNSKGQRSNYALRIMQNSKDGLRQVKYLHHTDLMLKLAFFRLNRFRFS